MLENVSNQSDSKISNGYYFNNYKMNDKSIRKTWNYNIHSSKQKMIKRKFKVKVLDNKVYVRKSPMCENTMGCELNHYNIFDFVKYTL